MSERRQARKDSMVHRVRECAAMVNASDEPWVVWCELNAEGDALESAIPDAVQVSGSDSVEHKERALIGFAEGRARVIVSKSKIAGWGLNWQHCRNVAFVGATDSFEGYYQSIRRCWRFGQTQPVNVYLFVSEFEGSILRNLKRKEADARAMFDALRDETAASVRAEIMGQVRQTNDYNASRVIQLPSFLRRAS